MIWKTACWLLAALSVACVQIQAAPTIVVGTHALQPNMPHQFFNVFVTGGDLVQGLNFNLQIGDGGSPVGVDVRPTIEGVDILAGIFASNNTGATVDSNPLLWSAFTTTASGFVPANGLLAVVAIDTTGWPAYQSIALSLSPASTGPTDFAGDPAVLVDGFLTSVPEPSGWLLAVLAAPAAALASRFGRRRLSKDTTLAQAHGACVRVVAS